MSDMESRAFDMFRGGVDLWRYAMHQSIEHREQDGLPFSYMASCGDTLTRLTCGVAFMMAILTCRNQTEVLENLRCLQQTGEALDERAMTAMLDSAMSIQRELGPLVQRLLSDTIRRPSA